MVQRIKITPSDDIAPVDLPCGIVAGEKVHQSYWLHTDGTITLTISRYDPGEGRSADDIKYGSIAEAKAAGWTLNLNNDGS